LTSSCLSYRPISSVTVSPPSPSAAAGRALFVLQLPDLVLVVADISARRLQRLSVFRDRGLIAALVIGLHEVLQPFHFGLIVLKLLAGLNEFLSRLPALPLRRASTTRTLTTGPLG